MVASETPSVESSLVVGGLVRRSLSSTSPGRLRELAAGPKAVVVPGAVDALTARLIERAGFDVCYVTGAGIANAEFGFPDVGLVTLSEMIDKVTRIADATDLPVIADADTGHGGPMSVMRTVHGLERAGVAAIQIEDQEAPKRCGHFDGKRIVVPDEMIMRIRAAVRARSDPGVMIIARTDARAVEGFDAAIERCLRYAEAGADALFLEAPETLEELERIPKELGSELPLVVNVVEGGRTPQLSVADLEAIGYSIVIHANMLLRISVAAIERALDHFAAHLDSTGLIDDMASWETRQELVHLKVVDTLEDELREEARAIMIRNRS